MVTGGASGLGLATVQKLSSEGAAVIVADINLDAAREAASGLQGPGLAIAVDVTDGDSIEAMTKEAIDEFGQIDVLVTSAGRTAVGAALEQPRDAWDRVIDSMLTGTFLTCQSVGRQMVARGSGTIVTLGSILSETAFLGRIGYCAAKAGVAMLTRVLAIEWGPSGVRVNCVGPVHTLTALTRQVEEQGQVDFKAIVDRIPMGRMAEPEDIADAIAFLASDDARLITGQLLFVDGGFTAFRHVGSAANPDIPPYVPTP